MLHLLDHWHADRPHVVAHDVGAAVALSAHLLHDAQFASLVLIDPVIVEPWGTGFFRLAGAAQETFAALPADLHEALVTAYVSGAVGGRLPSARIKRLVDPWLSVDGRRAFYRQMAELDPRDTAAVVRLLPRVRCRTHLMWGEDDPWIPLDRSHALTAALPEGTGLDVLTGTGHLAPLERPIETAAIVDRWLASEL